MFTEMSTSPTASRGRPPGRTEQGKRSRDKLYRAAMACFARNGFEHTSLRDIATKAGVSVGLLYKYFPDKGALLIALYDERSAAFAEQVHGLPCGGWIQRCFAATRISLEVLGPHRELLRALMAVFLTSQDHGLFSNATAFSRGRVQAGFLRAVQDAKDAPKHADVMARLAYLGHLFVVLLWVLDCSECQCVSHNLLADAERVAKRWLPSLLVVPRVRRGLQTLEASLGVALGAW